MEALLKYLGSEYGNTYALGTIALSMIPIILVM